MSKNKKSAVNKNTYDYDVIIVGAGVTGLTLAYLLSGDGYKTLIIEKDKIVGGLAKSFFYDKGTFDVGPHRFHTDKHSISKIIEGVLSDDLIYITRKSSVHLFGLRHPWPIRLNTVLKLPKAFLFRSFFDLFTKPKFTPNMKSFEEYVISKYGKTLYSIFFRDYSRKFCRIEPSDLHHDWAMTGVERAIIDKRLQINSLLDTIKVSLLPKPAVETLFIYPKNGCYLYCDKIARQISGKGTEIMLSSEPEEIIADHGKVKTVRVNNRLCNTKRLVWTGNIKDLTDLLNMEERYLPYLDIILYNIIIDRDIDVHDQWVYYGEKDLIFTRISFPHNFSPSLFSNGYYGLCVEVTVKDHELWENPQRYQERVIDDLEKINLIKKAYIKEINIEKIKDAYPIYHIDYRHQLKYLREDTGKLKNLYLSGRTGAFFYNNMDNSIESAMNLFLKFHEEDKAAKP